MYGWEVVAFSCPPPRGKSEVVGLPRIFELAKVPEDAGKPKAPQRIHKPKTFTFKPKRPTIKR